MFRILFDIPRSLIWNKDLLLHVNPYKTLENVHTKVPLCKIPIAPPEFALALFLSFFYLSFNLIGNWMIVRYGGCAT